MYFDWVVRKLRTQQGRPPCSQLVNQPSMAPPKRKTTDPPVDDTQNGSRTSQEHLSTQPPQQDNQPHNGTLEITEPSGSNQDELTVVSLQLQALEKQKDLAKQLATQQNALNRANQLAEAKRKVAAMQAEIDRMQQECASTHTNHEQQPPLGPPIRTRSTTSEPTIPSKTITSHLRLAHMTPTRHSLHPCSILHGHWATSQRSFPDTTAQKTQLNSSWPTKLP